MFFKLLTSFPPLSKESDQKTLRRKNYIRLLFRLDVKTTKESCLAPSRVLQLNSVKYSLHS